MQIQRYCCKRQLVCTEEEDLLEHILFPLCFASCPLKIIVEDTSLMTTNIYYFIREMSRNPLLLLKTCTSIEECHMREAQMMADIGTPFQPHMPCFKLENSQGNYIQPFNIQQKQQFNKAEVFLMVTTSSMLLIQMILPYSWLYMVK